MLLQLDGRHVVVDGIVVVKKVEEVGTAGSSLGQNVEITSARCTKPTSPSAHPTLVQRRYITVVTIKSLLETFPVRS